MDPNFFESTFYPSHKINPEVLSRKISDKYKEYDLNKLYTFEQLLFVLDQECQNNRCDRDVAKQLFEQSATPENKASINQMIFRYIQNLQTSRLCLIRQEKGIEQIKNSLNGLKGSKNCYVHLKVIQVTVYARYSSVPSLTYKISPSDIPPVTIVNTLNPVLNHQYTLQMQNNQFQLIFYESGLQIGRWKWPDNQYEINGNENFEHYRNITLQNLAFELRLKYIPKNSDPKSIGLKKNLNQRQNNQRNQKQAFKKLCYFQPFLDQYKITKQLQTDHGKAWQLTDTIIQCLPFMADHVRNLYYALILLILIESLTSIFWSMQFLDIALGFYLIGSLYDQSQYDMGMQLWGTTMGMLLLIIKSIWGATTTSNKGHYFTVFLILAILSKILCIIFAWFSAIRKQQIPKMRIQYFYEGVDPKKQKKVGNQIGELQDNQQIFIQA